MDENRILLIEAFLDDSINQDQMCDLRNAVDSDPAFRAELAGMLRLHGLISASVDVQSKVQELVRVVDVAIGNDCPPGKFASRVMRNLAHVPAPKPDRRGLESRKSNRFVHSHRKIKPAVASSSWMWVVSAACAALVLLTVTMHFGPSSGTALEIVGKLERATPAVNIERRHQNNTVVAGMAIMTDDTLFVPSGQSISVTYGNGGMIEIQGKAEISWRKHQRGNQGEIEIKTEEYGVASVRYPLEKTAIRLSSKTLATLFEDTGKKIELLRGSLAADVAPQPSGKPMRVETPEATATIVGTSFNMSASQSTRLEVTKGLVRLEKQADKSSVEVKAGFFAVAAPNTQMVAASIKPPLHMPVARWSFDECEGSVVHDVSGHGNDARALGVPHWASGKIGAGSFQCIGQYGYVALQNWASLNFAAGTEFTITGWVKSTEKYGPLVSLRNDPDSGADIDIMIGFDGGNFYGQADEHAGALMALVRQSGTMSGFAQVTGSQINDGNWHHFALERFKDGRISLYKDGQLQGSARGESSAGAIDTNLRALGAELCWAKNNMAVDRRYLEGQLDDVRVYHAALSANEIAEIANATE